MSDPTNPPRPRLDLSALTPKQKNPTVEEEPVQTDPEVDDLTGELTEKEKAELLRLAEAQVAKERRDANKKEFLKNAIKEARRKGLPGQEMITVTIDVAGHSDRIILDGRHYFHSTTYNVPKTVYDSLTDIMARTWEHEHEIGGANRDVYRRPMNVALKPGDEGKTGPVVRF